MRFRALEIFIGAILLSVASIVMAIQSTYFARVVKAIIQEYTPQDLGVSVDFTKMKILYFPPGVVIEEPEVHFEKNNVINLPANTALKFRKVEVTFQFFQLMTGFINVNALNIHGANLSLALDQTFFDQQKKKELKKKKSILNWWDELLEISFRSVSVIDSKVDIMIRPPKTTDFLNIVGTAKNLTVSKGTRQSEVTYDVGLNLGESFFKLNDYEFPLSEFQSSIEIFKDKAELRNISLRHGETIFHSHGLIEGDFFNLKFLNTKQTVSVRGSFNDWISTDLFKKFLKVPHTETLHGQFFMNAEVTGDILAPKETLKAKGSLSIREMEYNQWKIQELTLSGQGNKQGLELKEGEVKFTDGWMKSEDLILDFNSKIPLRKARLKFENADIRKILGPLLEKVYALHLFISGEADVFQSQEDKGHVIFQPKLKVTQFSLDNQKPNIVKPVKRVLSVPEVSLEGLIDLSAEKILFKNILMGIKDTRLKMNGSLHFQDGFNMDVTGPVNFSEIGHIAEIKIGGVGNIHWMITGKPSEVKLTFDPEVNEAYFLDLNLGRLNGRIIWNDGKNLLSLIGMKSQIGQMVLSGGGELGLDGTKDDIHLSLENTKGSFQDFSYLMANYLNHSVPWYPKSLAGDLWGKIEVSGKTSMDQLSIVGDLKVKGVDLYGEIFREGSLKAGIRKNEFFAEDVQLIKKRGRLNGNIFYHLSNKIKFKFSSEGLTSTDLDHIAALPAAYQAPISIQGYGEGSIGDITGKMEIKFAEGKVKREIVPASFFSLAGKDGRFKYDLEVFSGQGHLALDQQQTGLGPSFFEMDLNDLDLKSFLYAINPQLAEDASVEASVSTKSKLSFSGTNISKLSGNIDIKKFSLSKKDFFLRLEKPLNLSLKQGDYYIPEFKAYSNQAEIHGSGSVKAGQISYEIAGQFPLQVFEFLTPELPRFNGTFNFKAKLFGKAEEPQFKCDGELENAGFRLLRVEQSFESLQAKINWMNNKLSMESLSARLGGGLVTGSGMAVLHLLKVPDLDFKLQIKNPKFKFFPFTFIRVSGDMNVSGDHLPYMAAGDIHVAEALIQENFQNKTRDRGSKSSIYMPKAGSSAVVTEYQLFEMDLNVVVPKGLIVSNDLFDTDLSGKVKILGYITSPRILGRMDLLGGKLIFKDTIFIIDNGFVAFTNPAVLDPEFELSGNTEMKGYKVSLFASGKSSGPKVTFRSQPPLSQEDIVTLVTIGDTPLGMKTLRSQDRDAYSRDEVYSLLFSQSQINKDLKNKLGLQVGVDQAVDPTTAMSAFSRSSDPSTNVAPKVVLQKELVKNLNVKVGSTVGVGDTKYQDLNLEYRFNKNASVSGVYEEQRSSTVRNSRNSMGVDLKFKWSFK